MGVSLLILIIFGLPFSVIVLGLQVHRVSKRELLGDGELHCRKCDYILKGTSGDICPECGAKV